ncbi:OsmC family protein [Chitinimonas sp. BJYL2]|uniref:OsmC family protein n=1 Tax=Chitinimonas sp. BJYL2 TaxID=2976696 RepID=UPI0022B44977|nr:OsmC family protein [Chitinimonas sp. BJYL2]
MTVTASKADTGRYHTQLEAEAARWLADADTPLGDGTLPDPHQLLDAALAACTAITLRMYAERKGLALDDVRVHIDHTEAGGVYTLNRRIELVGEIDDAARQRLMEIADRCPVHKTLSGQIVIATHAA